MLNPRQSFNRSSPAMQTLESRVLLTSAFRLNDIIAGSDSSVVFSHGSFYGNEREIALGNKFIFTAIDGQHGEEAWVSDGTEAGTFMLKDIAAGPSSSQVTEFTLGNGVVYFIAHPANSSNWQVWKTDGTPAGTRQVTALPPSANTGNTGFIAWAGNKLFFETVGSTARSLWVTDGSAPGAEQYVADVSSGALVEGVVGSRIYFQAGDASVGASGYQLWTSDGTAGGTVPLTHFPSISEAPLFATQNNIFNGEIYFTSYTTDDGHGVAGRRLWKSNGTPGGTVPISSAFYQVTENFTVSGGKLYFSATGTVAQKDQIWSTDGNTVTKVTGLNTSPNSIRDLTEVNGTLYFTASIAGKPRRLIGLRAGALIAPSLTSSGGGANAGELEAGKDTVFFNALDGDGKAKLFESDGKSISLVQGDIGTDPLALQNVNGTLFYSADDDAHGRELHRTGVPAPTPQPPATKLTLKIHASKPSINVGEKISFTATLTGGKGDVYNWDFGDNEQKTGKAFETHQYNEASAKDGSFTVKLQVVTKDNRSISKTITVIVKKPKETIKVSFALPRIASTMIPIPFAGSVRDASKYKNLVVTIDWGNGEVQTITPKNGTFGGLHTFDTYGVKTVTATAHDKDNKNKGHKDVTLYTNQTALPNIGDVADKALGFAGFLIGGTKKSDKVEIKAHPPTSNKTQSVIKPLATATAIRTQSVDVFFNDKLVTTFAVQWNASLKTAGSYIRIATGGGNDTIKIAPDVLARVSVEGGGGNDTIVGGRGNDTLIGGSGTDQISGGPGKNNITQ